MLGYHAEHVNGFINVGNEARVQMEVSLECLGAVALDMAPQISEAMGLPDP